MSPRHHLDPATLVSHAAGALSAAMAAVAATHLEGCAHCRRQLAAAEHVGGALLLQQQPAVASAREAQLRGDILARLQQPLPAAAAEPAPAPMHRPAELLPRALHPYFGRTWKALRWRWVAPGVHLVRAAAGSGDTLVMLKIAPGKSIPLHSHHGSELTQILQGAYDDELGHFGPGDMADLDSDIEHRPITSPGVPCVCVAALDGPLQFRGWLARKMQPMVGL
ncbi:MULTISPECIES: ChrR family anti-sigma-E factor [Stenotrophomonas]|nr:MULTISPECIES: ChrR family anti-sigma-E factor [Stenotrophomonas]AUZ54069.1 transcriptional regulator [Stenotrophomonas acidaminiphila]MCH1909578.1 ChrR family anti-sigma-E factor [Stenotrophomonas sp. Y6]MTI73532.1 transcriptional regulator [Stenotrophomonas sp.]WPU56356.1 ChrR family anti-sigma-E factor [Stenotrophomonas acidaminiphila]